MLKSNKAIINMVIGLLEMLVERTSNKLDDKALKTIKDILRVV